MRITVQTEDGRQEDITEGVQVLYDAVHASMDWGSGFFDANEVAKVAALGDLCGFEPLEKAVESYGYRVDPELLTRAKDARALFQHIPKVYPQG